MTALDLSQGSDIQQTQYTLKLEERMSSQLRLHKMVYNLSKKLDIDRLKSYAQYKVEEHDPFRKAFVREEPYEMWKLVSAKYLEIHKPANNHAEQLLAGGPDVIAKYFQAMKMGDVGWQHFLGPEVKAWHLKNNKGIDSMTQEALKGLPKGEGQDGLEVLAAAKTLMEATYVVDKATRGQKGD